MNLYDKYFGILEIYETDDKVVQIMADQINLTKGWDNLPHDKHTAVAYAIREKDIWIFERKRVQLDDDEDYAGGIGDEYKAIKFPDIHINEGMEEFAVAYLGELNVRFRYFAYDKQEKKYIMPFIHLN